MRLWDALEDRIGDLQQRGHAVLSREADSEQSDPAFTVAPSNPRACRIEIHVVSEDTLVLVLGPHRTDLELWAASAPALVTEAMQWVDGALRGKYRERVKLSGTGSRAVAELEPPDGRRYYSHTVPSMFRGRGWEEYTYPPYAGASSQ